MLLNVAQRSVVEVEDRQAAQVGNLALIRISATPSPVPKAARRFAQARIVADDHERVGLAGIERTASTKRRSRLVEARLDGDWNILLHRLEAISTVSFGARGAGMERLLGASARSAIRAPSRAASSRPRSVSVARDRRVRA